MTDLPGLPTALYRLLDAERRLLYVGITSNVEKRFSDHRLSKPWWSSVADIKVEWLKDRATALVAEQAVILAERPIHNVQGNDTSTKEAALSGRDLAFTIAADLRSAIIRGEYRPGQQLPSITALLNRYNTTRNIVQVALAVLSSFGLTESRNGAGSFVRQQPTVLRRPATPEEVELLRLEAGAAIVEVVNVIHDAAGLPVEVNRMVLAGERYELVYEIDMG